MPPTLTPHVCPLRPLSVHVYVNVEEPPPPPPPPELEVEYVMLIVPLLDAVPDFG